MLKKTAITMAMAFILAACSSSSPRVIQTTSGSPDVRLTVGLATQIELPDEMRVQSVVAGNPTLVSAEQSSNVVNLIAKGIGETNLIIRALDEDNDAKVYQYRVIVQDR